MASKLDHGDGSNGDGAAKPIHFFKIILSNTLLEGKLRIPGKFVTKYGERLSNTAILKLPNGAEWKVNLEKRDGGIWFQKGWKEFAEYHSLAHGHLLVFRYEGTSHFHVLICDMSALEIDYPFNRTDGGTNSEELRPSKTRRTNENKKVETNSNLPGSDFHHTVTDCKGKLKKVSEGKMHNEGSSYINLEGYEAAEKFNSESTSFTVVIILSHLKKSCLCLPRGSLEGYVKPGRQNVTLLVGERSWRVGLLHYPKYSNSYLSASWKAFARENNLQAGDACLFKLLNSNSVDNNDMVIKVSISKPPLVKS